MEAIFYIIITLASTVAIYTYIYVECIQNARTSNENSGPVIREKARETVVKCNLNTPSVYHFILCAIHYNCVDVFASVFNHIHIINTHDNDVINGLT